MVSVTGSSGFVGVNLVQYLQRCKLNTYQINRAQLQESDASLLCPDGTDVVVHLAGKAHDLKKVSDPDEYYAVNFELTKKLYDAFLKSNATKFIFVSSVKAAADSVAGILTENYEADPQTHYGKSKLMAERYIQDQPLPAGKSYFILRPCMIHGPGNKGNLNLLYQLVKKGIPYPLAAFENSRSLLSIENLCFIIEELITREDITSGTYNVADDGQLSTKQIVTILAAAQGKAPKLWRIPKKLINGLAKIGDQFNLPLTTERLGKLTENYIVSNEKLKSALKKDLPVTIDAGLARTAKSFNNL